MAVALVQTCREEARWREKRAEMYGDPRNIRCAEALLAAAEWARTAKGAEAVLYDLLPDDMLQANTMYLSLNEDSRRAFSSFCFHHHEDREEWLRRVAEAHRQAADAEREAA